MIRSSLGIKKGRTGKKKVLADVERSRGSGDRADPEVLVGWSGGKGKEKKRAHAKAGKKPFFHPSGHRQRGVSPKENSNDHPVSGGFIEKDRGGVKNKDHGAGCKATRYLVPYLRKGKETVEKRRDIRTNFQVLRGEIQLTGKEKDKSLQDLKDLKT